MTRPSARAVRRAIALMLLLALPVPAAADMPMFPIFAAMRFSVWWTIPVALAIEAVALRLIFGLTWGRAGWMSVVINAATLALGFVLYPVAGVIAYPVLSRLVLAAVGGSPAIEFTATLVGAALIDTGVELLLLKWPFRLAVTWRRGLLFLLANLLSAGVLLAAVAWEITPGRMTGAEVARIEATYRPEIALMREMLDELPEQVTLGDEPWQTKWTGRDWLKGNRARADRMRFLSLTLGVPPARYPMEFTRFETQRFDTLYQRQGLTLRGGFVRSTIPGQETGVVLYEITRSVDGHVFSATAIFRAPPEPAR